MTRILEATIDMNEHVVEIKRPDGKKVKIEVKLRTEAFTRGFEYEVKVFFKPPRKQKWQAVFSTDDYQWRKLDRHQKEEYVHRKKLEHVTEAEIHQAKLDLWHKLKPVIS